MKGNLLYGRLASWWPLLSGPEEYAEEAAFYAKRLPFRHSDFAGEERSVFVGVKPRG